MNRAEALRRRRCRLLQLGMLFAVLLPVFSRTWISLGVGLGGLVLLVAAWWRACRGLAGPESGASRTRVDDAR